MADKTKKRPRIQKPFLQGNAFSPYVIKRGARVFALTLVSAFLFLFVGQLLVVTSGILKVLINVGTLAMFAMFMYWEGARLGEDDVAFAEIAYQRRENGMPVSKEDLNRCFHPIKGFVIVLMGLAPLLILTMLFAVIAVKQVYQLGSLPSWLAAFERNRDIHLALNYYQQSTPMGIEGVLRVIVRLLLFPFVSLFGADNANNMLLMERLSPLLVSIAPSFYGVGYLTGPYRRALVHGDIAAGIQKKQKRDRKAQKQRIKKNNSLI